MRRILGKDPSRKTGAWGTRRGGEAERREHVACVGVWPSGQRLRFFFERKFHKRCVEGKNPRCDARFCGAQKCGWR